MWAPVEAAQESAPHHFPNYLPRIGKYIRKNEEIPNATPTVLMTWVTIALVPSKKVAARVKEIKIKVPIIEISKGTVRTSIDLVLSLKMGVSTKLT